MATNSFQNYSENLYSLIQNFKLHLSILIAHSYKFSIMHYRFPNFVVDSYIAQMQSYITLSWNLDIRDGLHYE